MDTISLLFVEVEGELPVNIASALEAVLCENPNYAHCVQVGQLAPVQVVRAPEGASARYVQRLVRRGHRLGDIKPSPLSKLTDWSAVLGQQGTPA